MTRLTRPTDDQQLVWAYIIYTEFRPVIRPVLCTFLSVSPDQPQPCLLGAQSARIYEAIRAHMGGANVPAVARAAPSLRMSVQLQASVSADAVWQPVAAKMEACQRQQALKLCSRIARPQFLLTRCSIQPAISYPLPVIRAIVTCCKMR
ncbi:uncharacterized protein TrAtP1_001723 [Trichoderma atroviride]|uniref:uncharacterized protein n=1 Tax=Hypocrea atroviridis TaxID=63577 RepID=UPI00331C2A0D|nr:hypothetical protein TrAtP1_001723 [Trichoderma atroviride]